MEKPEQPWDNPAWQPETYAVSYIRAIREKKIIIRRNKWRPDPKLNAENHRFLGFIGSGQFGSVLDIVNTDTNEHYALKLQSDLKKYVPSDMRPEHSLEPPRTASSEATKSSSQSVEARSLRAKRHRETRAYLLWIRTGHPNICNLEAFVQYTPEYSKGKGDPAMGLYFEYCDLGSLDDLSNGFRLKKSKPPELFIWHVFYELMSGIAFLHNQHPDYNTKKEHKDREPIFQDDYFGRNIFLKWGPDREGGYPHIKIGDFGISYTVPPSGNIPDPEYSEPGSDATGWESINTRIKNEVWYAAVTVYELAHTGFIIESAAHYNLEKQVQLFEEIEPIDSHLSTTLDRVIRGSLNPYPETKTQSGGLYLYLKTCYEKRVGIMYRKLPDWVEEKSVKHEFDQKRLKELDEGRLEIELAAFQHSKEIDALAKRRFEEYLDSITDFGDDEYEILEKKFYDEAKKELDEKLKESKKIKQHPRTCTSQ